MPANGRRDLIRRLKVKMEIKETEREFVELIYLAKNQVQVVSCCEHGNEPSDSMKCIKFLEWLRNC